MQNIYDNPDVPILYDHDLKGGINDNGEINQIWEKDALNNAIKLWIASFKGEMIRRPNRGGYITRWLLKPMQSTDIDQIKMALRDGLEQDFVPYLEILDLSIIPDYENRQWKFYMEVYAPDLKIKTIISERIKSLS